MANNLSVFHDFKDSLKKKKQLMNGDWEISAKVIYKWSGNQIEEILPVYLRINEGKIALEEGNEIYTDRKIHLDFKTDFDNPVFSFNSNGILEIKGRSHPMYGSHNYEVTIVPL